MIYIYVFIHGLLMYSFIYVFTGSCLHFSIFTLLVVQLRIYYFYLVLI